MNLSYATEFVAPYCSSVQLRSPLTVRTVMYCERSAAPATPVSACKSSLTTSGSVT